MTIAELRAEKGLNQLDFGQKIGVHSKAAMSRIENSNECALDIALKIETLSHGRINAADICEDVAKARSFSNLRMGAHASAPIQQVSE